MQIGLGGSKADKCRVYADFLNVYSIYAATAIEYGKPHIDSKNLVDRLQ